MDILSQMSGAFLVLQLSIGGSKQIIWFPSGGAIPQNEIESFLNWFPVFNFGRISQNRGSFEGCFVFFLLFPRR